MMTLVRLQKRLFEPDDPFFEEGNLLCRLLQERYLPSQNGEESMEEDTHRINCQMQGCYQQFLSLRSYEEHYATRHRNVCQACGKILPTQHLLDLHINELHNPMFDIQAKTSAMYQCLVLGCQDRFNKSKHRKKHLVEVHKYPSSFRFERSAPAKCKKPVATKTHKKEVSNAMDTLSEGVEAPRLQSRFKYNYKVPASLSFGQGVQRGFVRRRPPRGNHLTKAKSTARSSGVNIEDMDMKELQDALDS